MWRDCILDTKKKKKEEKKWADIKKRRDVQRTDESRQPSADCSIESTKSLCAVEARFSRLTSDLPQITIIYRRLCSHVILKVKHESANESKFPCSKPKLTEVLKH